MDFFLSFLTIHIVVKIIETCYNMNMVNTKIKEICVEIENNAGTSYFVGGYTRDRYLNLTNNDIDIEVFNLTYEKLKEILSKYEFQEYKKFGVFQLEFASFSLPRTEVKKGSKHCSFDIVIDPFLSVKEAAKRRDFTINAIYINTITNEVIDPFNGINDIENKMLKHITDKFIEDDLRLLRAIRFACIYNLDIDRTTLKLMKNFNIDNISETRSNKELDKIKNAKYLEKGNFIIEELGINEKIRI